MLQFS
ncbi:UNVERIFIED_CONTAM: hypothetical protein GTU68_045493 [Idotea baltica]